MDAARRRTHYPNRLRRLNEAAEYRYGFVHLFK